MEDSQHEQVLPGIRVSDAVPAEESEPGGARSRADGKLERVSLMRPQELAERILPQMEYEKLLEFATHGCPAECGPPWPAPVIAAARRTGPHMGANTPENVELIWEDIQYQVDAGFVKVVSAAELFDGDPPAELKILRVAVIPQTNRRGRIILNLSAEVELGRERATGRRRWKTKTHPSVNETTEPVAIQEAVKALGTALSSLLFFLYDTDPAWEIDWQKIDLSDGFWHMIVEEGREYNFVFQLPKHPGDDEVYYVVPASLQMGWKNSPAFF